MIYKMCKAACSFKMILLISILPLTTGFRNTRCQNSIKPRNSSTEIPRKGVTCQLGDTRFSSELAACRIPCVKDDDCVNHGWRMCCPTLPGSRCKGECLIADPSFDATTKTCTDVHTRNSYSVGETFLKEDKCCTCLIGGINCATVKGCRLGCKTNSRYYQDGESIPSKSCHNCSCRNGSVVCSFDVNCFRGKCSYEGKLYGEGDLLSLQGGCKECVCRYETWNCITCNAAISTAPRLNSRAHVHIVLVSLMTPLITLVYSFAVPFVSNQLVKN